MKVRKARPEPKEKDMAFFNSAITVLQTLVVALGAGHGVWGVVNLLEGYGNDNPGAKSQGMKHVNGRRWCCPHRNKAHPIACRVVLKSTLRRSLHGKNF